MLAASARETAPRVRVGRRLSIGTLSSIREFVLGMAGVSFGSASGVSFPRACRGSLLLDVARDAEAAGFDSLWSGDHVMMYEPDRRVRLAPLGASRRHLARPSGSGAVFLRSGTPSTSPRCSRASIDLSTGRLLFGVGVGGEFAKESGGGRAARRARRPHRRGARRHHPPLDQAARQLSRAQFSFRDVALEPPPRRPRPPISVGGRSDAALRRTRARRRRVARVHGDGGPHPDGRAKIAELARRRRAGPDAEIGLLVFAYVAEREAARRRVVADLSARYRPAVRHARRTATARSARPRTARPPPSAGSSTPASGASSSSSRARRRADRPAADVPAESCPFSGADPRLSRPARADDVSRAAGSCARCAIGGSPPHRRYTAASSPVLDVIARAERVDVRPGTSAPPA